MDKFFVNPGSATGAFASGWPVEGEDVVPSFCLMDVSGDNMKIRVDTEDMLTCGLGSRDILDTLCLPAEERC
jgi:predicted phosphodiesterase